MKIFNLLTLLTATLLTQQAFAKIKVEVNSIQTDVNAVIKIAENCTFTGIQRYEDSASFYATCNGIKKSITVTDDGLLNSFVVKTIYQEESISIDFYKSTGLDWDKLNMALSKNTVK